MQWRANIASKPLPCGIRPAVPRDYERMAELAEQLGYPCTGNDIQSRLAQMMDAKQHAVYVAELPGGRIAGWIGLYIFRSVEQEGCAGISGLIVDQQIRSRGIGKLLLDAAENWAQEQGCTAISVHSNITRGRAHRFYGNNGYQHVKTQKLLHKAF